MSTLDLTEAEQANARSALNYLRYRAGSWQAIALALGFERGTLMNIKAGKTVGEKLVLRIARLADVTVEAVLTGKFPPPGTCPNCGCRATDP